MKAQWRNPEKQPFQIHDLWAKYDRSNGTCHPLIYHLLDVAAVASRLWDLALSPAQKTHLQELMGLDDKPARQQLALLAGLHDIGKATPAFQKLDNTHHGAQSAAILYSWLEGKGVDPMHASRLASATGGHHNRWITAHETMCARTGKGNWPKAQRAVCAALEQVLNVRAIALPSQLEDLNAFAVYLSGLASVCDWIGSNTGYLPYEESEIDLDEYYARVLVRAHNALHGLGWLGWSPDGCEPTFESLFPAFTPNALQRAVIDLLKGLHEMPRLVLIEAPTGAGKTEAALFTSDLWLNRFRLSGLYVAMPTRATSKPMHRRVSESRERRYPKSEIATRLVHAQAALEGRCLATRPKGQRVGDEGALEAADWFGTGKRALLSPFAVGTIDQALHGVGGGKHHFVRLFGLSHKVVIFDEIHSYDVYMTPRIERLIQWLAALGSPMIMLSATLSRAARAKLLRAAGAAPEANFKARNPRVTVVHHDGTVREHELPTLNPRSVRIRPIPGDYASLQREVLASYQQGGCIAVVCNTVNESIDIARALRATEGIESEVVLLFHARFPAVWRGEIENQVLRAFGKGGGRPERLILVTTQISEQSLDLDFDLIISPTAPIDFLIQRLGRLHRHPGRERPMHLKEPTLLWRQPELDGAGVPYFGRDEAVYPRHFLLKTVLLLRGMKALHTPTDTDALVNFVYDRNCVFEDLGEALQTALEELDWKNASREFRSRQHLIGSPADELLFDPFSVRSCDDESRQSLTRDIPSGIDIVCLIDETLAQLAVREPSRDEETVLLQHKLTIRHRGVMRALEDLPEHKPWANRPLLKHTRALVFADGRCQLPGSSYSLLLTCDYGLEIIQREAE